MRLVTTWSIMLSVIFSSSISLASDPAPIQADTQRVVLSNVELSDSGWLSGQYLSKAGQPVADVQIFVKSGDTVQTISTDDKGRFTVANLTTGQCTFQIEENFYVCRVWQNGAAPPKSVKSIAIVSEEVSVLGNNWMQPGGYNPLGRLMALSSNQKLGLGVLAIAGAGVAIAVTQNDHDNAS